MPDMAPRIDIDPRFSSEDATPRPWADVVEVLGSAEVFWLATVRDDGRPHVTPLPAIWDLGALHFCTGPNEQKARNIERNPRCALTTGTNTFSGLDVVVEGVASRVTDRARLEQLAGLWLTRLDWLFEVVDGGFRDPKGAVPEEYQEERGTALVFAVEPVKALAFAKSEPYSQTRYRF
jgi:general stress protein 26